MCKILGVGRWVGQPQKFVIQPWYIGIWQKKNNFHCVRFIPQGQINLQSYSEARYILAYRPERFETKQINETKTIPYNNVARTQ